MINSRIAVGAAFVACAAVLAGCQMGSMERRAPVAAAARPTGVEGDWLSTDGVSVSSFAGGQFVTRARDTGNTLANGTYSYSDNRTVAISMTSLIRQTTSNVNCALVTPAQLNCTSSSGAQFTLVRPAQS